jgi:hypothetical protein
VRCVERSKDNIYYYFKRSFIYLHSFSFHLIALFYICCVWFYLFVVLVPVRSSLFRTSTRVLNIYLNKLARNMYNKNRKNDSCVLCEIMVRSIMLRVRYLHEHAGITRSSIGTCTYHFVGKTKPCTVVEYYMVVIP